jgi:phenylalanyl-tRNA synthetase beta chain
LWLAIYLTITRSKYCNETIAEVVNLQKSLLKQFDIKQPVFYAVINWSILQKAVTNIKSKFKELSKFPAVQRDISLLVDKTVNYATIEEAIKKSGVKKLSQMQLFDLFENEKLGADKKSLSINLTFVDDEKTLTDAEIENFVNKILNSITKVTNATLRS